MSGDQYRDVVEQLNRDTFIKININQIILTQTLLQFQTSFLGVDQFFKRIYNNYLEELEFPNDKRKDSKSSKRKLKDDYLMSIFKQLSNKSETKIPQIISLIKDNLNA